MRRLAAILATLLLRIYELAEVPAFMKPER